MLFTKIRLISFVITVFLVQTNFAFCDNILNIIVEGQNKGLIKIELRSDLAPQHVNRIKNLAEKRLYDNVAFHRVIDGFMAQTGDIQYGNISQYNPDLVGKGGSSLPNLKAEFTAEKYLPGTLGMARSQDPNSANSQFFIMFKEAPHLNNKYTVVGNVIAGMDVVLNIKKGDINKNGAVENPDYMKRVYVED